MKAPLASSKTRLRFIFLFEVEIEVIEGLGRVSKLGLFAPAPGAGRRDA